MGEAIALAMFQAEDCHLSDISGAANTSENLQAALTTPWASLHSGNNNSNRTNNPNSVILAHSV